MMGGNISVQSNLGSGSTFTAVTTFTVVKNTFCKPDVSKLFDYILAVGNDIQSELLRSQLIRWSGKLVSINSVTE